LASALLPLCALALDLNSLKPQGYVSDFAHVIDGQSRARLEEYCGQFERATGVQIAIVTIDSLDGEPIEDVTNTLYRKWGVGKKGANEGIMLLAAMKDHRDRIEVGYGLEPILPDGFVGGVLREFRPLMRQGEYGQAFLAATQEMGTRIAQAKNIPFNFNLVTHRRVSNPRSSIPFPLIVIGIIIVLLLISRGGGGGFWTGLILGNLLGGGRGGGGWGGGFGGFGGGDSGGGGASSDW